MFIPAHKITIRQATPGGRWFVRCSTCGRLGRSYMTKAEAGNRAKNHQNGADAEITTFAQRCAVEDEQDRLDLLRSWS